MPTTELRKEVDGVKDLLDLDELHRAVSARAGLDDYGDPGYREPMQVLLDSYRRDAQLTELGALNVRTMLETVLETKLRQQHGYRTWPQARQVEIVRPIFVTGLPRTGTTALHRMLCLDPRNQGLELWLTEAPQPRPPVAQWAENDAYERMRQLIQRRNEANPAMNGVHFMTPDTVEECWRAERLSMRSIAFQNLAHLPSYGDWLATQSMVPAYHAHRDMLRLIGLHEPDRAWVLKSPSHLFGLDALMQIYPDALVIQTHRHPHKVIASVSSLNQQASAGTSTVFTPAQIGRDCLKLWARGVDSFGEQRRRFPAEQFIDVDFDDLLADAPGVVAQIYARAGRPFEESLSEAIRVSNERSKSDERRPDHRYSLADFELTEADVDREFARYTTTHFAARGQ